MYGNHERIRRNKKEKNQEQCKAKYKLEKFKKNRKQYYLNKKEKAEEQQLRTIR